MSEDKEPIESKQRWRVIYVSDRVFETLEEAVQFVKEWPLRTTLFEERERQPGFWWKHGPIIFNGIWAPGRSSPQRKTPTERS